MWKRVGEVHENAKKANDEANGESIVLDFTQNFLKVPIKGRNFSVTKAVKNLFECQTSPGYLPKAKIKA